MDYLTFVPIWEKLQPGVLFRAPKFKKTVFLTFDDGPNSETTPKILAILAKFEAKATFFIRGDVISTAPGTLLQTHRQGHTIGNHAYSHIRLSVKKRREIVEEIEKTNQIIAKTAGVRPQFFRPPYGKIRPGMIRLVENLGLKTVLWSVDSRDYIPATTVQDVVRQVLGKVKSGSIVLFHDAGPTAEKTSQALPIILQNLQNRGFQFLPLSVLLDSPAAGGASS